MREKKGKKKGGGKEKGREEMEHEDLVEGVAFILPQSKRFFGRARNCKTKNSLKFAITKIEAKNHQTSAPISEAQKSSIEELDKLHGELKTMIAHLSAMLEEEGEA